MRPFASWELHLLDELRVGRLGTIASDGRPHLVPVCYARIEDTFFIPIDEKPKRSLNLERVRNIERDPRVTLLFDRYDDDWTRLAWIRAEGTARVFPSGGEFAAALAALRARYAQYAAMALEERPLIQVTATSVSSWRWSS